MIEFTPEKSKKIALARLDLLNQLPGYDTLRMILSKKSILVEGPSDELIIQKAYFDKYDKLPISDDIDVISLKGLSFLRFLEIAEVLNNKVTVVKNKFLIITC